MQWWHCLKLSHSRCPVTELNDSSMKTTDCLNPSLGKFTVDLGDATTLSLTLKKCIIRRRLPTMAYTKYFTNHYWQPVATIRHLEDPVHALLINHLAAARAQLIFSLYSIPLHIVKGR